MSTEKWNCAAHHAIAAMIRAHLPSDIVSLVNAYYDCWSFDEPIPVEPAFDAGTNLIITDSKKLAVGLAPVVYTDRNDFWPAGVVHPTCQLSLLLYRHRGESSPIFVTLDIDKRINEDQTRLIRSHRHCKVNVVLFVSRRLPSHVRDNVDAVVCDHESTIYEQMIPSTDCARIAKAQRCLSVFDQCHKIQSFLIVRVSKKRDDYSLAALRLKH